MNRPIGRFAKWLIGGIAMLVIGAYVTSLALFSGPEKITGSLPLDSKRIISQIGDNEGNIVRLDLQVDTVDEALIEVEEDPTIPENSQGETAAFIATAWNPCDPNAAEPNLEEGEQPGRCLGERLVFLNTADIPAEVQFNNGTYYIRGIYSVGAIGPLRPYENEYGSSTRLLRAVKAEDAS